MFCIVPQPVCIPSKTARLTAILVFATILFFLYWPLVSAGH
jgi:hypothetical protein